MPPIWGQLMVRELDRTLREGRDCSGILISRLLRNSPVDQVVRLSRLGGRNVVVVDEGTSRVVHSRVAEGAVSARF